MAGTFGYELDITKIPEEDRQQIPAQTAMYHKYNDLIRSGDYLSLIHILIEEIENTKLCHVNLSAWRGFFVCF